MRDFPQGADWWKASDGSWYPPDAPKSEAPDGEAPAPPEPDGGWSTAAGQGPSTGNSTNAGRWWVIAGFVVLVGVLAMMGASGDDDDDPVGGSRAGAFDVCTQFVEQRLKAPGTASFRNFNEDDGEVRVAARETGRTRCDHRSTRRTASASRSAPTSSARYATSAMGSGASSTSLSTTDHCAPHDPTPGQELNASSMASMASSRTASSLTSASW